MNDPTLDPSDWEAFGASAHQLLDRAIERLRNARGGRVWTPLPAPLTEGLRAGLPVDGIDHDALVDRLAELLPYGVGNTHPRFFGWVHGAGNPGGILAEIAAAAMNANLGGRDHGAMHVERQVLDWCRAMMGFPETAGGLIVSGTSMATIIALKAARDLRLGQRLVAGCRGCAAGRLRVGPGPFLRGAGLRHARAGLGRLAAGLLCGGFHHGPCRARSDYP